MKRFFILLLGASAITLSGCATNSSSVPIPMAYEKVWQRKMQAAYHWSSLAKYEAGLIVAAIKNPSKPIYVEQPVDSHGSCGDEGCSPFTQAYHNMLQSQLIKLGALVVTDSSDAGVQVNYVAQVLDHKDRGYVVWDPGILAAPPPQPITDTPTWSYKTVDPTEVIITTQVTEGKLMLYSGTDIFYYNPGDTDHYLRYSHKDGRNVTFKVVDQSDSGCNSPSCSQANAGGTNGDF